MSSDIETESHKAESEGISSPTPFIYSLSRKPYYENSGLSVNNAINEQTEYNKQDIELPLDQTDLESLVNNSPRVTKKWKKSIIRDSDSEEEVHPAAGSNNEDIENATEVYKTFGEKKFKRFAIADSDSESETEVLTVFNKSFSDDVLISKEEPIFTTNLEGKLIQENSNTDRHTYQAARLSMLCDPESSEEETNYIECNEENSNSQKKATSPKKYNKKQKQKTADLEKPKRMTGKDAAELRQKIKSESQRMIREKNVSLPYHKPKSYGIKEFLSRRPKFSSVLPCVKAPASVAIKMSTEQLSLISEKLKERQKAVKQFFKSDSESEDDPEDKDYVPSSITDVENVEDNVEQTTEITQNGSVPGQVESAEIVQLEGAEPGQVESTEPGQVESAEPDQIESAEPGLLLYVSDNAEIISDALEKEKIDSSENEADKTNLTGSSENEVSKTATICPDVVIDNEVNGENTVKKQLESNPVVDCYSNTSSHVSNNLPAESSLHKDFDNPDECVENIKENSVTCQILRRDERTEPCSMEYEFNLDGLEENSENIQDSESTVEKDSTKGKKSGFEYTDLDKEIENFGSVNNEDSRMQSKALSKLELIKEHIANIKPKLSGGPNILIDLETGVTKPNEVTKLRDRFMEHNFKKPTHKDKIQLSIVSIESGEIHKETVAMKVDDENETMAVEEKPGAKLQRLRGELQNQMAQKRSEFWQNKAAKENTNEEKDTYEGEKDGYEGEKEECGLDDDILDDEEEELELMESSEEDEVEDYADRAEKKKSDFIDEEAEESEEGEMVIEAVTDDETDEADNENDINNFSETDINEDNEFDKVSHDNASETQAKKKTFKKILKGFTEDSDEEEVESVPEDNTINKKIAQDTLSQDDFLPPHQPRSSQTPIRQTAENKFDFEFLTPISYITGLQSLNNSASKNLKDSPVSSFKITNEPSPLKENNWERNLQKKLFMDTEITDSQVEELCSGKFPETQEANVPEPLNTEHVGDSDLLYSSTANTMDNEEQLLDLCSGKFPTTAELAENRLTDHTPSSQDLLNICSGKFTGFTANEPSLNSDIVVQKSVNTYLLNTNKEVKSLDEDQDLIISQLIDEEEMEKFKKRFESPLIGNSQSKIVENFEEVVGGGVIDSDDEADIVEVKRKNQRKLTFSDDEESESDTCEEEVIDLHDDVEDDRDVAYDSEENEIELVDDRAGADMKPSDFFEREAELSESDWDSADEDEKDLDTMEFEQGDAEKYDEKKIRTDLEKIHMRRLLDDDTREVKLLQEMLLEDGELHGTGRERQFKWKNIDSAIDADTNKKDDEDDVFLEEEETEEQWRKQRHEREMFLKKKLKKSQQVDDDLLSESQLLKVGQRILQKSQSNSQNSTSIDKSSVVPGSPVLKQSFTLLNKRGSFLSRSEQVLQRLAEYNKVTSATLGAATAKNSRNFLFQTVRVEETLILEKQDKKRKALDGTPNAIKKLRLSSNFSPAVKKKPNAKTKLLGNL